MRRHSIIARLGPTDISRVRIYERGSVVTEIRFIDGERRLGFGLVAMVSFQRLRYGDRLVHVLPGPVVYAAAGSRTAIEKFPSVWEIPQLTARRTSIIRPKPRQRDAMASH